MRVLATVLYVPRYSSLFFFAALSLKNQSSIKTSNHPPHHHAPLGIGSRLRSDPQKQARKSDRTSQCIVTYPWHDHCRDKLDIAHAGLISLQLCLKSPHQHLTARQIRVRNIEYWRCNFRSIVDYEKLSESHAYYRNHRSKPLYKVHPFIKLRSQRKI